MLSLSIGATFETSASWIARKAKIQLNPPHTPVNTIEVSALPCSCPKFRTTPITVAKPTTNSACTTLRTAVARSLSTSFMPNFARMLIIAAQTAAARA